MERGRPARFVAFFAGGMSAMNLSIIIHESV
jgi:hypothetical protein